MVLLTALLAAETGVRSRASSEIRRHRGAARKGDEHAAGDVALGQPELRCLDAIHVEADLRLIHHLVYMHVGRAGNVRDLLR